METISLARDEWESVRRELETHFAEAAPPGLRERIDELLRGVPRAWEHEACSLDVDAAGADAVRAIVRRGRGQATDPDLERSQRQSLGEADRIVREFRQRSDRTEPESGA